jgi:hypothetical protein
MFFTGAFFGWASCAIALVDAKRQADKDKAEATKGKIFTRDSVYTLDRERVLERASCATGCGAKSGPVQVISQ